MHNNILNSKQYNVLNGMNVVIVFCFVLKFISKFQNIKIITLSAEEAMTQTVVTSLII